MFLTASPGDISIIVDKIPACANLALICSPLGMSSEVQFGNVPCPQQLFHIGAGTTAISRSKIAPPSG